MQVLKQLQTILTCYKKATTRDQNIYAITK